jgi:hypothetical protein
MRITIVDDDGGTHLARGRRMGGGEDEGKCQHYKSMSHPQHKIPTTASLQGVE